MTSTKTKSVATLLTTVLLMMAVLIGANWRPASAQTNSPPTGDPNVVAPADEIDKTGDKEGHEEGDCTEDWEDEESLYEDKVLAAGAKIIGIDLDALFDALDGGQSMAQVAEAKGVPVQAVIDAMVKEANTLLDELEASGELTANEAKEWRTTLVDDITYEVNAVYVDPFLIAAQTIGLDEDAFWTAFESGQTVAQIAQANGVAVQTVVDALIAAENAVIDQELAAGYIDETEAQEWRSELDEYVKDMVNLTLDELEAEWDTEYDDSEYDGSEYDDTEYDDESEQ